MSFDLTNLPTKTEFLENTSPSPSTLSDDQYLIRKTRIQNRIIEFFGRTNHVSKQELRIRTAFLNTDDKNELISQIESKGYSCAEVNGFMIIN